MTTAEIITIGTELLLGEIQDTNKTYLARQLRPLGVDLFRTTTVGDNPLRIADAIQESFARADIVITTGGLGPTIDDPTRNAVAIAFKAEMVFHADLWESITNRFLVRGITPTENNRKQAYLPACAIGIENPVGTAPAFYILDDNKMIICLPGVPAEMETIFERSVVRLIQETFSIQQVLLTRVLHVVGLGESLIDERIADLETLTNPTVGLAAHPGIVDIRITAKAATREEALHLIHQVESELEYRLPEDIVGADENTLQHQLLTLIKSTGHKINVYLYGESSSRFLRHDPNLGKWLSCTNAERPFSIQSGVDTANKQDYFSLNISQSNDAASIEMFHVHQQQITQKTRFYNGPPSQMEQWLENISLDFIWRQLKNTSSWSNK